MRAKGNDPRADLPSDLLAEANRRAMPQVAVAGGDGAMMAIGVAIAAALGIFTFVQMSAARLEPNERPEPQPVAVAAAPAPAPAPRIPPRPAPVVIQPTPEQSDEDRIRPDRLRAPALIVDNSTFIEPLAAAANAIAAGATPSEQFAFRAGTSVEPPATATQVEDLESVVLEGAMISGVLETALNSDLPGYVRAIVSDNVRSFDGTRVLVPRGSRLIGQYRSGLAVGESRAFVIWTRLVLPDGVSVRLASPATDSLGRSGLGGKVDRHFVQRFGSAILLSVIGAGLDAAVNNSDNQVVIGSTSDAYSIAQAALQGSINIPPTIKVPQGSPIRIFVARDLYFPVVAGAPEAIR